MNKIVKNSLITMVLVALTAGPANADVWIVRGRDYYVHDYYACSYRHSPFMCGVYSLLMSAVFLSKYVVGANNKHILSGAQQRACRQLEDAFKEHEHIQTGELYSVDEQRGVFEIGVCAPCSQQESIAFIKKYLAHNTETHLMLLVDQRGIIPKTMLLVLSPDLVDACIAWACHENMRGTKKNIQVLCVVRAGSFLDYLDQQGGNVANLIAGGFMGVIGAVLCLSDRH